jgi:signal transduction histidine kinase
MPRRIDYVMVALLSAFAVLVMVESVNIANSPDRPAEARAVVHIDGLLPSWAGVPLILLVTVPLLWRRSAPVAAVGASFAGLLVNEALVGSEFLRCGVCLIAALVLAFSCGSREPGRLGLVLSLALVFVSAAIEVTMPMPFFLTATVGVSWAVGRLVRSRRRIADELIARNGELRRTRDERARLEVAADRARISRELDELLQRRLGDLARMADQGVAGAGSTELLAEIERESRSTLDEMRATVGALRDGTAADLSPQPTLTHLEALLLRAKGDGARLAVEGSPRVLPAAVELSAYRIVEHLLDALDDAPGVTVTVRFGDAALELAVSGPARRRAREAIERARVRAQLHSGTVEATVRGGRAEARASLPVLVPA